MGRKRVNARERYERMRLERNKQRLEYLETLDNPSIAQVGEIIHLYGKELERIDQRKELLKNRAIHLTTKYREIAPAVAELEKTLGTKYSIDSTE